MLGTYAAVKSNTSVIAKATVLTSKHRVLSEIAENVTEITAQVGLQAAVIGR